MPWTSSMRITGENKDDGLGSVSQDFFHQELRLRCLEIDFKEAGDIWVQIFCRPDLYEI